MDEPLETTNGWIALTLPDAAEVPRERIALALRHAMQLAGRSRRGVELGSATLSCMAHLVGADAGVLARADSTSLAAEMLAALAHEARSIDAATHAAADPPTTEPSRRPRRSMRKILADPNPGSGPAGNASSTSADHDAIGTAKTDDPLADVGWRVVALRPDSAMADADHRDLRPTLAPVLAALTRQLLLDAIHAKPEFDALPSSTAAHARAGGEASARDRLLKVGTDVVVSIIRCDPPDALREPGRGPVSKSNVLTPRHASLIGNASDADPNEPIEAGSSERDRDAIDREGRSPDVGIEPPSIETVQMTVGGHVSQLAVDSAALRAAIITGTSNGLVAPTDARSADSISADASTDGGAALAAATGAFTAMPAEWSMVALRCVATDPGTLALLQAFHRAAVDAGLLVNDRPDLLATLSRGERETVQLLLTGKSETVIASLLRRSPHTVHSHVKRAYRKLGVASRAELMAKLLPG